MYDYCHVQEFDKFVYSVQVWEELRKGKDDNSQAAIIKPRLSN